MDERIENALQQDLTIDITTTGRRSGEPRRIEIWFHNVDGRIFITGTPGRRDWYANLLKTPEFTFHLKESVNADLPASATPVSDAAERRKILSQIMKKVGSNPEELDERVQRSPLVEVEFMSN